MAHIEVEEVPAASRTFWGWVVMVIAVAIVIWLVVEFAT